MCSLIRCTPILFLATDAVWLGFRIVRPLKVPDLTTVHEFWNTGPGLLKK